MSETQVKCFLNALWGASKNWARDERAKRALVFAASALAMYGPCSPLDSLPLGERDGCDLGELASLVKGAELFLAQFKDDEIDAAIDAYGASR